MQIKVSGHSEQSFNRNLDNVLRMATLACLKAYIPEKYDMEAPEQSGNWFYKVDEKSYQLCLDHKAFIRGEGENFIILEFYCRYDFPFEQPNLSKSKALSNLLLAFFTDFVELVES